MLGVHVVCWENRPLSLETSVEESPEGWGRLITSHPAPIGNSTEHDRYKVVQPTGKWVRREQQAS